ncbi:MAG: MFS transporter [Caldilineales bacterium]|nr:MFS transporter [Caldilineales bacterium]
MSEQAQTGDAKSRSTEGRLRILLAMAMFVLVIDTSLMNVSISYVVNDVNTTVSGIQAAISLEALVSAAFILIGGKIGDLIGRKRAYALGLVGYAIGAIAMTLAQSLTAIILFWAITGGLGAALLLPAMQSLIHGNFEGVAQKKTYAAVGAASGVAAAIGPLLGGFITTYLSWRVGFLMEAVIIAIVLLNIKLVKDVPYTGPREIDIPGAAFSVLGMGGVVISILLWEGGGQYVGLLMLMGVLCLALLTWWLVRAKKAGKPTLLDPDLFRSKHFRFGVTGQTMQNIALGGLLITIPIYFQMVFEYSAMLTGLFIAPMSLSLFAIALLMGRQAGKRRSSVIIRVGFAAVVVGVLLLIPLIPRADSGVAFVIPMIIVGIGMGFLVSQLNNYTLAPISDERVSEAAGVNSAGGSFGLSFGLAFAGAIMLAGLSASFTNLTYSSAVLNPDQQEVVAVKLEEDAQVMSNTQLQELLVGQPQEVQEEIIRINTEARNLGLQIALLVPLIAGLLGFINSFRMVKLPDLQPSEAVEGLLMG